jgi:hypothetical protein
VLLRCAPAVRSIAQKPVAPKHVMGVHEDMLRGSTFLVNTMKVSSEKAIQRYDICLWLHCSCFTCPSASVTRYIASATKPIEPKSTVVSSLERTLSRSERVCRVVSRDRAEASRAESVGSSCGTFRIKSKREPQNRMAHRIRRAGNRVDENAGSLYNVVFYD